MNYVHDLNLSNSIPTTTPTLSVVVPAHNEQDNLEELLEKLTIVMEDVEPSYEVILVDDGSTDDTVACAKSLRSSFRKLKLVCLSRNFGKEAALNAGMTYASGKAVVQIDADLQHPPELIREFVEHWRNGIHMVYGARVSRNTEGVVRRVLTRSFYKIFSALSDVKLMDGLGDFLLMDRKVVDTMLKLNEKERFTKGLYAWVGFSQLAVPFEVRERKQGDSSFSFFKLFSFAMDAIISFGTLPLKVWTYVGLLLAIPSLAYGVFTIIKTVVYGIDVPGYASLMVAVCFFSGIQLCGLGILGEYLGRISTEVKQRPLFLVSEEAGFEKLSVDYDLYPETEERESGLLDR